MKKEMKMGLHFFICIVPGILGTLLNTLIFLGLVMPSGSHSPYPGRESVTALALLSLASAVFCLCAFLSRKKYTPGAYVFYLLFQAWQFFTTWQSIDRNGSGNAGMLIPLVFYGCIMLWYVSRGEVFISGEYVYTDGTVALHRSALPEGVGQDGRVIWYCRSCGATYSARYSLGRSRCPKCPDYMYRTDYPAEAWLTLDQSAKDDLKSRWKNPEDPPLPR